MKTLLILIISSILLNGCAAILSGSKQQITITNTTKNVSLKVDSLFISKQDNFNTILQKDLKAKQLKFDAPGFKSNSYVILQDKKSAWNTLSWFPFAILAFYPPIIDKQSSCTYIYNDIYNYPELRKYYIADSLHKKLYINNISFEVNHQNYILKSYNYDDYKFNKAPDNSKNIDSLGIKSSALDDDLELVLKKMNFIDTLNQVFIDNTNTLNLSATISNISLKDISKLYFDTRSYFCETEITTKWYLQSIYADTIFQSTIKTTSGQYSFDYNNTKELEKLTIQDALESSMLDFIDSIRNNKLIDIENKNIIFNDKLKILKPNKVLTTIDEAMKATVTIKNAKGHGSGFFISNDGYIITNHHVISKKNEYTVITNDGTEYKAKIIRSNKAIDLALIKIEGNFENAFNLPELKNFEIGDEIFAIGTPKSVQLGQSVSKGVVSGNRKYDGFNFIQTDIGINKGNSGGPLLHKNGNLIAVVEYKITGQGMEGLNFSIPAFDIMKALGISY